MPRTPTLPASIRRVRRRSLAPPILRLPFPLHSRAIPILYMVIERYRDGDPEPVYRRFRESGRMLPGGLDYLDSWVSEDGACCFQLMRAADAGLFPEWFARWADLVDFELVPVVTSAQAAAAHVPA